MSLEDSGVIDLFAMQKRLAEVPKTEAVPRDLFSAPPPAFTTDLYSDPGDPSARSAPRLEGDEELDNPFAKAPNRRLYVGGAMGGALLMLGILVASVTGGTSAESAKANASSSRAEGTVTVATVPPPAPSLAPLTLTPPPSASTALPAPPTTGAAASSKPPPARAARPTAPVKARPSGPTLTKVQSTGVR